MDAILIAPYAIPIAFGRRPHPREAVDINAATASVLDLGEAPRAYNCGACEKCLRTMIGLHAAGALNRATTFPHTIDHRAVRHMRLELVNSGLRFLEDLLGALGSSPRDHQIKAALRHVIRRTLWKTRAFGLARRYLGPHATDVTVAALGRLQRGVARRIRRLKAQ